MPFRIGARAFTDFALHPRWSLTTLMRGSPALGNFTSADALAGHVFDRNESRAGADWTFFDRLRETWPGNLVVKGVLNPADALDLRDRGADAIHVQPRRATTGQRPQPDTRAHVYPGCAGAGFPGVLRQ